MTDHWIENETKGMKIADLLRADIINGVFKAGSRITIREICERYGTSNVPVREAFRTLESEKLLEINAYKGATISSVDQGYVSCIYELQRALELLIYEKAFPNLTEELFESITRINEEIGQLQNTEEDRRKYVTLNRMFHESILRLSTNGPAVELYNNHSKLLNSIRKAYLPVFSRIQEAYREHCNMIQAMDERDLVKLKASIDAHGSGAEQNFMRQYVDSNHAK